MLLVTVADDRSGRKGGLYGKTQDFIMETFMSHPNFGIDKFVMWKWNDIRNSSFYEQFKHRLDITDPQTNGRLYKSLAIRYGLDQIQDGEYLVYNDTSPELWSGIDKVDWNMYSANVLKSLCDNNGGILTAHAEFDHDGLYQKYVAWPDPGYHTHEVFTNDKCRNIMDPEGKFTYCLQHASGFMVLKKNNKSISFVDEWIKFNSDPDCSTVTPDNVQHRSDQSVSGILINKIGNKLVRCLPGHIQHTIINPYNLLSFSQINTVYNFTDSIQPMRDKILFVDPNKKDNPKYTGLTYDSNWCVEYRKLNK